MLKLFLDRSFKGKEYTIGHLYKIDNNGKKSYICDTIEDVDRGLTSDMPLREIQAKKVYSQTAIPRGTYKITTSVRSGKFSDFKKYPWSRPFNGFLPRFVNVKGFEGVLIHPGSTAASTAGCLIVGENKVKGKVINSQATFNKLMNNYILPAVKNGEKIEITIK